MKNIILTLILICSYSIASEQNITEKPSDDSLSNISQKAVLGKQVVASLVKNNAENNISSDSNVSETNKIDTSLKKDNTMVVNENVIYPWSSVIIMSICIILLYILVFRRYSKKNNELSYFKKLIIFKDIQNAIKNSEKSRIDYSKYKCKNKDKLTCILYWFTDTDSVEKDEYEKNAKTMQILIAIGAIILGVLSSGVIIWPHHDEPIGFFWFYVVPLVILVLGTIISVSYFINTSFSKFCEKNLPLRVIVRTFLYLRNIIVPLFPKSDNSPTSNIENSNIISQIKSSYNLYDRDVKKWLIFTNIQLFAFSFGIGYAIALATPSDTTFTFYMDGPPSSVWFPEPWTHLCPEMSHPEILTHSKYSQLQLLSSSLSREWWRFIYMAMLLYGALPRIILWYCGQKRLEKSIDSAIENMYGTETLYHKLKNGLSGFDDEGIVVESYNYKNMTTLPNSPREIQNINENKSHVSNGQSVVDIKDADDDQAFKGGPVILWSIDSKDAKVVTDDYGISLQKIFEIGGIKSYEDDLQRAQSLNKNITIIVPSWEAGGIEYFLKMLDNNQKVKKVRLVLARKPYKKNVDEKDFEIWKKEIYDFENISIKGYK